ncbi:uncharacterized protein LOC116772575 [Danaus plexippus]|uniref:uncharacterized protein LOC116772575 n=1 Tax=Danaus plexippus TaxID=13037 RepID=UPI002AB0843F|nr:uncharacterized protein LOC116772575 [Danaus plexippus]
MCLSTIKARHFKPLAHSITTFIDFNKTTPTTKMFKLFVLCAFLAVASAAPGLVGPAIASPWGHGAWGQGAWGGGLIAAAPAVVSAPLVSAPIVKQAVPVATSYANTVRIATPAVAVAHAPAVVAAAPLGHGW